MLIVAHHYVVNSGLLETMEQDLLSGRTIYFYLLGMWGKTGINCFVLITGYFMCRSHITVRKFLKLLLEVMFYNIVIWTIFTGTGYESFSLKLMVKELFPITSVASGFTSCFLIFYLFIPFLNVLICHIDKKMHLRLVALCLFTYTLLGTIPKIYVAFNYVTWFSVLFFVSSYIRLYGLFPKIKNSQWGMLTIVFAVLASLSVIGMLLVHEYLGIELRPFWFVSDSNAFFAFVVALCSFMYFKDLPMKHSRVINTISASTFGVLCIHANSDTMRQWLWRDTVDCVGQYSSEHLVGISLLSVLLIFVVCIAIDYVRIHTIEKWTFLRLDRYLSK